jgi:hypothetical protein
MDLNDLVTPSKDVLKSTKMGRPKVNPRERVNYTLPPELICRLELVLAKNKKELHNKSNIVEKSLDNFLKDYE